jgi:RimJ/RimL family protein N-acetyltransferase
VRTPSARPRYHDARALRRLARYALDELHLERLDLITDIDNLASHRVAEKVGFRREGVLRSARKPPRRLPARLGLVLAAAWRAALTTARTRALASVGGCPRRGATYADHVALRQVP